MASAPKYFMYFPGNYRWSAAFVNMLGTAPFGGVDMSELHQIGRMLEGKSGDDDEAWFAACVHVADVVRGRDLFPSTSLHRLLQALLGLPTPRYRHHRLVVDGAGAKLSKSAKSESLEALREGGFTAQELRAALGFGPPRAARLAIWLS